MVAIWRSSRTPSYRVPLPTTTRPPPRPIRRRAHHRINFALVKERVRYDYYQRFTLDPPRFDINTKMPKLAPDGKKTKVTTILEGDARQQFDAVWHFINTAPAEGN